MLLECLQLTMISNTMKHIKRKLNHMCSVKAEFTTKQKTLYFPVGFAGKHVMSNEKVQLKKKDIIKYNRQGDLCSKH